jgi:Zn finger protein HypA/HybF involved in hydrogenase expression
MPHQSLEVADIFRQHGAQWRQNHQGHINLNQYKVMTAIERCRSAELGGHVLSCESCHHQQISYNSCRNRHCPKCQASAAKRWYEARQQDLLMVPYYHVVFTLPEVVGKIAYQNKSEIYSILFKSSAETLLTIAADPKHLGARIGVTMVLHSWGSALMHHPHVHCVVPGGGVSLDGQQWIACKPGFFLPVRVLSRLFRRLFLHKLLEAHQQGKLSFHGQLAELKERQHFNDALKPAGQQEWVVYAKRPFAGPKAVLAYLARYTHRVAIANSRLVSMNDQGVTFGWKDYRNKERYRAKTMTLSADEFIRRFLLHVLPKGFHRIRHYGLLSSNVRVKSLVLARRLLDQPEPTEVTDCNSNTESENCPYICPKCSSPMVIIETFERGQKPRAPPESRKVA